MWVAPATLPLAIVNRPGLGRKRLKPELTPIRPRTGQCIALAIRRDAWTKLGSRGAQESK